MLRWLAALAAVLFALALAAAYAMLLRALPADPDIVRAAVSAAVDIRYDGQRRPFVSAETLDDALFAQGWLHVRERLWQMELMRRAGRGRLAEVLGPELISTDEQMWRVGVPQLAARLEAAAGPLSRRVVGAYVAGANRALAEVEPPPEFLIAGVDITPWRAADVYAVGALTAFQSGRNYRNELLRMGLVAAVPPELGEIFLPEPGELPDYPYTLADQALALHQRAAAAEAAERSLLAGYRLGSNGWAVAPARSASGHALFAFDSHDGFSAPNLMYEVHLFFAGGSIRGWSVPGLPMVINGYNQHLAWGFTNIGDSQDLFVERRAGEGLLGRDGSPYAARRELVKIPVRGEAAYSFVLEHSRNGPLISSDPPIALRWSGHHTADLGLDALFEMNLASGWAAFQRALDRFAAPSANVTYADREGRIAFRTVGLLPLRGRGRGLLPQAGFEGGSEWLGFVPMTALPEQIDPPLGYMAAANARVHAGLPLISADNAPGYRMRRLHDAFAHGDAWTLEDMQALQVDTLNMQAAQVLPAMTAGIKVSDAMRRWQNEPRLVRDSTEAVVFELWYVALARNVFGGHLSDQQLEAFLGASYALNHALDHLIVAEPESPWWRGERKAILQRTYDAAVALAAGRVLGDVQRMEMRHEMSGEFPGASALFDVTARPGVGGNASLLRLRHRYTRPHVARGGATVRVVLEMGDPIRARAVIPGGQSGHALSAHYDDQLETYLSGGLYDIAATAQAAGKIATQLQPEQ